MTARIGSLFSGYGGLDMAVEHVTGASTEWHSEYEPPAKSNNFKPTDAPAKLLEYRFPDVPNLGDISRIDWMSVPPVHIITAGYPCQPDSLAGKGLSVDDARYLWPEVARAIRFLGPELVVLENVFGHVVRGFAGVAGSMAELGYDAQWTTVRASDVGAPHERKRLFVVAYPRGGGRYGGPGERGSGWRPEPANSRGPAPYANDPADDWQRPRTKSGVRVKVAADSDSARLEGDRSVADEPQLSDADRATSASPDSDGDTIWLESVAQSWGSGTAEPQWGVYEPAIRRWERTLGRSAPDPTELAPKGGQRLAPRFVEWMMGLPAGWVTDVPGISRNDQLKMLGNGVVPQQAAAALDALLAVFA